MKARLQETLLRLRTGAGRLARTPVLWLALVFLLFGSAGVALGSWRNLCADCPSIARIYTWEPQQTSKLLSHDGRLVAEIGVERRTPVSVAALPPHVPQAFLAIEDRRFYRHRGYDVRGIARAAVRAVARGSYSGGGGSTLTQQLARNMFQDRIGYEKRIQRKLKELQVALALENVYTKDQILEAYLNQVNYAHGWWGIQTAARNYFGKNASELNPAEAALLAAVVNRPTYYSPFRNPEQALRRRNLVLEAMAGEGYLSREEAGRWKEHPLPTEPPSGQDGEAPYFEEWVRQILDERYGSELYTTGLRVYTTLDVEMQRAAQAAMDRGWAEIEARPGFRHPKYEEYADQDEPFATPLTPYLQGTFIAVDPHTGAVRALVGGRDFTHSKFNRAVQARRQAGSSFKPYVYAAALSSGIPASHVLVDAPVVLPQVDGTEWKPQNYTREFLGPITIREGLRRSINMIAIKLGLEVGLETVAQTSRRLGIRTPVERYPSTAIGAAQVIPVEMAEAYGTFATLGTRVRPFPIVRVESAEGEVLWEPAPERVRVLDSLVARVMVSLLEDVANRGTAQTALRVSSGLPYELPAAGKTGTTNDATDVWFVGFTPDLLAAVWFGMDLPQTIRPGATGGGDAAPVWGQFMRRVYYGDADGDDGEGGALLPLPEPWPMPSGLVTREVDDRTGLLASEWCPREQVYTEIFIQGTEPTEYCDLHGPTFFGPPRIPD